MNAGPLVSVVLPVHRAARTVSAAIRSILTQSYRNLELLVIANGSDAATMQEIGGHMSDPRLRPFELPEADLVDALNLGLKESRGAFLARMDADDLSATERLELQVGALQKDTGLGGVSCRVGFCSTLPQSEGLARYVDWQNRLLGHRAIFLNRFVESPLVHPSMVLRREVLLAQGGYRNGDFPEDYELWLRLLESGARFRKLPQTLLTWQDSAGRLTRTDTRYSEMAFHRTKAHFFVERWNRTIAGSRRPLLIWGAGRVSRRFSPLLEEQGLTIEAFIDIDPRKIGNTRRGRPIIAPDEIPYARRPFILSYVPGEIARRLIRQRLRQAAQHEGKDFLFLA
ncbi:MAG: glycosyltransferase [Spirochaetales bacterium]|nr:glycosyltransferase [Leptospiraceae bacterium]MCP5481427.1 glycosyltransferase [Spirochaetales bacterium]MCP5486029.1 glycosyltransferase [Spirochaetales bacterium]